MTNRNLILQSLLLTLAHFLGSFAVIAQEEKDYAQVTSATAITGATVIPAPGQLLEDATILIEDGLITAVGTGIDIPAHAKVMEADSFYVYPGFIDALSYAGVEDPKSKKGGQDNGRGRTSKIEDPDHPPNEAAGILPQRKLRSEFVPGEKNINQKRKLGFTLSHSVPRGRLFPGRGALVLLGEGSADELIIREDVSVFSTLQGTRGVYPSNLLGVMAKWRELFRQAEVADIHKRRAQPGEGLKRPQYDQATLAMIPVTKREIPVFIKAVDSRTIGRALKLQDELGFDLVIGEAGQVWQWIDELKTKRVPVLLSLNLPEDKSEKKKKKKKSKDKDRPDSLVKDPEQENFNQRRQESLHRHYRQADSLEEAGISFGFSTLDVEPKDIHQNLRIMIEYGLSEETALAALTVHPAGILRIEDQTGTIEENKIANLVLTTGPLFDEDVHIRHVFVEGVKYTYEKKKEKKDKSLDEMTPVQWSYSLQGSEAKESGELRIVGKGDDRVVYVAREGQDEKKAKDAVFKGENLTFELPISEDGRTFTLKFDLIFDEDKVSGEVETAQYGVVPVAGERIPNY